MTILKLSLSHKFKWLHPLLILLIKRAIYFSWLYVTTNTPYLLGLGDNKL